MKTKYTKMQSNGNDFLVTEDYGIVAKTNELSDRKRNIGFDQLLYCLLYTSPSPRDRTRSRMPSSA